MHTKRDIAIVLSAKLLLAGLMVAQTASQTSSKPVPSPVAHLGISAATEAQPNTAPVFWISNVEVIRTTHSPQLDVIRARALTSTAGWEAAELVPITRGTPIDGILDLAMVAQAPAESSSMAAYAEIEAVFTIEPGHPFKGVRVHGAANRVVLNTLPGYAVSANPPNDCVTCQGKLFVSKGQRVPAGETANVVREEDLPRNLRVIRESDGLDTLQANPNRMTVMLNETGHIVSTNWD
ncbi:hypothetical protein [Terriglobus sp.]|uniref:hypothetical protein n=1 Tax=Terriglobus sp. TaxID=1889013 RepID=UPI003AFFA70B